MSNLNLDFKPTTEAIPGLSAWELFLRGAGISEGTCAALVSGRSQQGRAIRSWVHAHYTTQYVPEIILETLGLHRRLELRWHRDGGSRLLLQRQ
jgi:hypothetical protein